MRTCKVCQKRYKPHKMGQIVCGIICAAKYAKEGENKGFPSRKQAKGRVRYPPDDYPRPAPLKTASKRILNDKGVKVSRSKLVNKLQIVFNKYIRLRDAGLPCISCDCQITGTGHASHYCSVGSRPNLRFEEDNVHLSCVRCNKFLHGNLIEYRKRLIDKIGKKRIEELEADYEPRKYSTQELIDMIFHYSSECERLSSSPM